MSRPWAALRLLRALVALVLLSSAFALPARAQQPASPVEQLDRIRLALDRIEPTLKRDGLSVQALYQLGHTLNPLRLDLRALLADLEPQLAQTEAGLKQLGAAPARGTPAESEAIATERMRLNAEFAELDAAVKQGRILAARADDLGERVTERRRAAYAKQLFEQSPSVLSPFLWLDAAQALPEELATFRQLVQEWAPSLFDRGGLIRVAGAIVALTVLSVALTMIGRWWRRRIPAQAAFIAALLMHLLIIISASICRRLLSLPARSRSASASDCNPSCRTSFPA